ncbi:endogenous retrovirus group K member 7 Pro protein-like protein [Leptotrombidium deliense]|uniref:Endogenous retrovirus group K member 7 Pro protein-like protein n=1 Tax=Leptotrombidium deliense TaxID=299467 RepID=A0A443RSK0_9ACAR|nr:endogenous retrovirus group K member 7 Pro protein-like protein [Leptotrombidium deliense]
MIFWTRECNERPSMSLIINGKSFFGLLDTGVDTSIITAKDWPRSWPLQQASQILQGLRYAQNPDRSSKILSWKDPEGHTGTLQPYVLTNLPVNLWGRGILSQMGIVLTTVDEKTLNMMTHQGYVPGREIGKLLQGRQDPVITKQKKMIVMD